MKVLMLNGSCNPKGCTYTALTEVGKALSSQGIDYEIVQLDGGPVRDCIGCNQCSKNGCVFTDDGVNDFIAKARQADGFVFGTPVYYAHPSGRVLSFLDRVFYAGGSAFAGKPGAAVGAAPRAGPPPPRLYSISASSSSPSPMMRARPRAMTSSRSSPSHRRSSTISNSKISPLSSLSSLRERSNPVSPPPFPAPLPRREAMEKGSPPGARSGPSVGGEPADGRTRDVVFSSSTGMRV